MRRPYGGCCHKRQSARGNDLGRATAKTSPKSSEFSFDSYNKNTPNSRDRTLNINYDGIAFLNLSRDKWSADHYFNEIILISNLPDSV